MAGNLLFTGSPYKDAENMEKAREGIMTRKEYQENKNQMSKP